MGTVKLSYAAMSNINFRGVVDTGIPREEWDDMSEDDRTEVMADALFELVDIDVKED